MAGTRLIPAWGELSATQRAAWVGFLRAHARIARALDAELREATGLTLSAYDVLAQLSLAGADGLRMTALADAVVLTPSGLTRLVERLEREGLVERCPGSGDSRVTLARITEPGLAALDQASPTHVAGVRTRFLDRLSPIQLRQLTVIWRRLLEGQERRST